MKIQHDCPQCGGPVTLDETDRLFSCGFCRVKLYISSKDYFRYYLSLDAPIPEETMFVPYWRFRGMYFTLRSFKVTGKVLDTSFPAGKYRFAPASLGLRTQSLKLRFATSGIKADFLRSHVSFSDIFSMVEESPHFKDGIIPAGRIFHKAFIGETISKIYSPVHIKNNTIYDGILNRPIAQYRPGADAPLSFDTHRTWQIKFIPALCPGCGWDLEGEKNSIVLCCRNCDSAWQTVRNSFKILNFGIAPWKEKDALYIPFWRLKIKIDGLQLESYADLITFANLPKAIRKEWSEKTLYFWSPAFTVRPGMFLRLARQLTISQLPEDLDVKLPKSSLCPVTLNVSEAFDSVKIMLADITKAKKKIFPLLPDVKMSLQDSLLVYLPFAVRGNEFIQTRMNFSIQRNALRGL